MAIRLSGINSGLDTDALVKELVSAYSLKTQKYEKQQTKLEWKKEAWQGLNTKIYGLYKNISNLQYDAAYNLKKTTVSDSTKATVTASSSAVSGVQKLKIEQTAQAAYITGARLEGDVTKSSTLKELGYDGGDTTIEVRSGDGKTHKINVSQTTTISEIVDQLQKAGLNASFDENNGRFFISAKESGGANDFNLCSTDTSDSQSALKCLGLDSAILKEVIVRDEDGNPLTGADGNVVTTKVFTGAGAVYQDGLDLYNAVEKAKEQNPNATIESYLRDLIASYEQDLDAEEEKKATLEETLQTQTEAYDALVAQRNAKESYDKVWKALDGTGLSEENFYQMVSSFYDEENEELTAENAAVKVEAYLNTNTTISLTDEQKTKITDALKANIADVKKIAEYEGDVAIQDINLETLKEEIATQKEVCDETKASIAKVDKNITEIKSREYGDLIGLQEDALVAEIDAWEEKVNTAMTVYNDANTPTTGGAIKIDGRDAEITLNGATFTSASNSFSINGLTIEVHAETQDDEELSISTAVDTQGIYDKIKDFLTEYNNVINEITKRYNADTAKGYEPLTDEEKDAMSETQIEKWEDKIKDSLLRRDTSLGNVMNAMINSMSQTFEVNGQKLSLSNFGISTLGFLNAAQNEQYAYHIDGDEDDSNTSGKTDKLMAAIQTNPDQIIGFMKKLTKNLYDSIDEKMKSTELSSVYKVYNDKEMDKEQKELEELIKKWEDKVAKEEDYYYNKFSDMEVALSKLQSQTSALGGLLGQ